MKSKGSELQKYIFTVQVIMMIILALLLGGIGLFLNLHDESVQRDKNLKNVAESIAHSRILTGSFQAETPEELMLYMDTMKETLSDIDVISVVGEGNVRLYHSNHDLIGTVFEGSVPDLSGQSGSVVVSDNGPSGLTRRAYAALIGDDGTQIGFVMAIMLVSNIQAKTLRTVIIFAVIILAAVLIELFISYQISSRVRKKLMGYEPDAFSAMFRIRDTTLESLDEGIVAVDRSGSLQFINEPAAKMLNIEPAQGEVFTEEAQQICKGLIGEKVFAGEKERSAAAAIPGSDVLIDRIPITEDGETVGAIGILHNRTEYTRMAEDLAGTRFLVDSMRANNHDFTNKLHVIMGLLQMEMYDEAKKYIENITIVQRESISQIMHAINDPALAALLIGKTSRASELNVRLILKKGCSFNKDDVAIPDNALVTIIGNLIDNALEAINGDTSLDVREVYVGINSDKNAMLITVDDTGPGIPDDMIDRIFEKGVSGKGSGRGIGLWQVKETITSLGGNISIETQVGTGTSFTVSFTEGKE